MRNSSSQPQLVPDIPPRLRTFQGAPRPDKVELKVDLFATSDMDSIEPGLYVKVDKGDIVVRGGDNKPVFVGGGEALHAGTVGARRLRIVPAFQKFDTTPRPGQITAQSETMMNLFGARGAGKESIECTVN